MINEEKIEEKKIKGEKINNINEIDKIEYKYEILNKNVIHLNKEVFENTFKEIEFKIMIKNNYNLQWPANGKTKLINDKNSDIKANDIILNNLLENQYQLITFKLNIDKMETGLKKYIFHFSVNNVIYGEPLILTVNIKEIKEDERVSKFRKEFYLSKKDYDSKKLLNVLHKANFNFEKAFNDLFI